MVHDNPILTAQEEHGLYLKSVKCLYYGVSIHKEPSSRPHTGRHARSPEQIIRDHYFNIGNRGNIRGFSSKSALRLRRAILELRPQNFNGSVLGLTLTLPFKGDFFTKRSFDCLVEDYKKAFHRFSVAFSRRFPSSCAIFRHELQQRRAPHCHMVVYLSSLDFKLVGVGRNSTLGDLKGTLFGLWLNSITGFKYDCSLSGFMRHGIHCQIINGDEKIAAMRYLCDHASKHKVSQLGYKGKQWGFIRRSVFCAAPGVTINFRSYLEQVKFIRMVRRVCRYQIKADCNFGRKLTKVGNLKGVYFVSLKTCHNILRFLRSDVSPPKLL